MVARRASERSWTAVPRLSAILVALATFQLMATAAATHLETTDSLAGPALTEPRQVVMPPVRPATAANSVPALGRGWAGPVSAATAQYAFQIRSRYYEIPSSSAQADEPPLTEVIGLNKAGIADVVALARPGPVISQHRGLTLIDHPESPFHLTLDTLRGVVVVTVEGAPDVQFEVDYRDGAADLHRIGVTPVLLGHRLEGTVPRSRGELTYPLITPTYDAGSITQTTVSNVGGGLLVRFDGGPYANLSARQGAEGATYLEVRVAVSGRKVLMDLAGLYYVRPAVGTEMLMIDEVRTTPLAVTPDTPAFLRYVESPIRVDVTDPAYGNYVLRTDVARLQVQWDGVGKVFELDFDHAFKDRGQSSVQTRLVFRIPVAG